MNEIAAGVANHLGYKTPTLGRYRYIGVPGCWAERYGSRAPEWRSK